MHESIKGEARRQIGRFVNERRQELLFTVYRVAKLAGVDKNIVLSIEKGENYTVDSLIAVLGALRCKVFFETSDPNDPVGVEKPGSN